MKQKTPAAPKGWTAEARKLWKTTHEQFALAEHHECLLRQACELLSRAGQARQIIDRDGLTCEDRYGQVKVSPLVDVERQSVNSCRLVLRELGLDCDGAAGGITTPDEGARLPRLAGYA